MHFWRTTAARRRHFQGISSSMEMGMCPKASRNCLDGFFLRLWTSPRSITTSCSYVTPSIRIVPKENLRKACPPPPVLWHGQKEGNRNDPAYQCGDIGC